MKSGLVYNNLAWEHRHPPRPPFARGLCELDVGLGQLHRVAGRLDVLAQVQRRAHREELRQRALQGLLLKAESGLRNDYEIYWLKYRLKDTAARLDKK